jgi:general L-amino acid transport system permease protein
MADYSYVRKDMLPEREPPASAVGILGWLRENLFSGWFNSILTVLSLFFIYWILAAIIPWLWSPTWGAGSLSACREIIAELGKEHGGACYGVITERWQQLLFGFYPDELRWRPILTFVGLFVALAPVLFTDTAPRKLLWFTGAYLFLAPWLMWGGAIWTPLLVAAGPVLGFVAYRFLHGVIGNLASVILGVLIPVLFWLFLVGPISNGLYSIIPLGIEVVESRLFGGFMLSVWIGVVAISISLVLGVVLALGRQSDLLIVKYLSVGFIEFIRGVPLITLLFVASTLLNIFMPPGTNFDIILCQSALKFDPLSASNIDPLGGEQARRCVALT